MSRVLTAIVLMGFLVGLYGNLQHFHHDFLNLSEVTGGGAAGQTTIFMGNAIFAAAVLSMTVPVTLLAASIFSYNETWMHWGLFSKIGKVGKETVYAGIWASLLAVQLLGLMFTFSRGPWVGTVLALGVFLVLVLLAFGWQKLIQTGIILGLAAIFSVAFLHWQNSVSIVNVGPWLGLALIALGLTGAFAVLYMIERFGRMIILMATVGAAITLVGAVVLGPSALSDRGNTGQTAAVAGDDGTSIRVTQRITSIKSDVLSGFAGGRSTHWAVSWTLIKDRPWFEFDDLSLSWLRPIIGYGPDLFRYTYLLESPPDGRDLLPLEPDHAHNFFIHQIVEQGILGGLASLGLFASVFVIAGHHLIRRLRTTNPMYQLLLIGLTAILFGRFLEMMVGVARISDLTVLWVIFGLFAALIRFDDGVQEVSEPAPTTANDQSAQPQGRRNRQRAANTSPVRTFSSGLVFRLAMVAWLMGAVGVVTWQKSINSVRASVAERQAISHFRAGELEESLVDLDRAINLAPGVPNYYNNRAQVYLAYQIRPDTTTEPGCDQQSEREYLVCLGIKGLESNLESVNQQPFNFKPQIAAGNSAFNLNLNERAAEFYRIASGMVPHSWQLKNGYGDALSEVGLYDDAVRQANLSLAITGDSTVSGSALLIKGSALKKLNRLDDALAVLKQSEGSGISPDHLLTIQEILETKGLQYDTKYFNALIEQNVDDIVSTYFRGLANLAFGNLDSAILDLQRSFKFGLNFNFVRAEKGYAHLKKGNINEARSDLNTARQHSPQNALFYAYLGELHLVEGDFATALNMVDTANVLNPELGLAYLIRAKTYLELGLIDSAKIALEPLKGLDFPRPQEYIDSGGIFVFLDEEGIGLTNLDRAIEIIPDLSHPYDARAKANALLGNYELAIDDFDRAISRDPTINEYYINRGVVYQILGESSLASEDFEIAASLGATDIPGISDQNTTYFYEPFGSETSVLESSLVLNLQNQRQWLIDLENYGNTTVFDPEYLLGLQIQAEAFFNLGMWPSAIEVLSLLLQSSPNIPEALRLRGQAYLELNRTDEAINDFQQGLLFDSSNPESLIARGMGFAADGKYELAREDYNQAIRFDARSSEAFSLRGYLSVETEEHEKAFADLDHAIGLSPLNHDAYAKRAEAFTAKGEPDLALLDLNKAINLSPTNSEYFVARGLLFFETNQIENAFSDFNSAVELQISLETASPMHARSYILRGRADLDLGNADSALKDALRAISILNKFEDSIWDKRRPEIVELEAGWHELVADAYSALGDDEGARIAFRLAADQKQEIKRDLDTRQ